MENKDTKDTNQNNPKNQGTYIDGKRQIADMLKSMPQQDKYNLLKLIKVRNPQLAEELLEQGISFDQINILSDKHLILLFSHISAPIMGLALKEVKKTLAQRLLGLASKDYAEKAFSIMQTPVSDEKSRILSAQDKIIRTALSLFGKKVFL
jgi:flagellar motor switch protein FliG